MLVSTNVNSEIGSRYRYRRTNTTLIVGSAVGCRYRWPYSANHPDCWKPPIKGILLALDNPRAWQNTYAFPSYSHPDGPSIEQATTHVLRCLKQGLLLDALPVNYSYDGGLNTNFPEMLVQWETRDQLSPYAEELREWEEARAQAYNDYSSNMTLQEIKDAINEGKTVHWKNEIYVVQTDGLGQWFIMCIQNNNCIGLTHQDGITLNGEPKDFYISSQK